MSEDTFSKKKSFKVGDYAEMHLILKITSPTICYINLQYITLLQKTPWNQHSILYALQSM